jgi:hypothetical protein
MLKPDFISVGNGFEAKVFASKTFASKGVFFLIIFKDIYDIL